MPESAQPGPPIKSGLTGGRGRRAGAFRPANSCACRGQAAAWQGRAWGEIMVLHAVAFVELSGSSGKSGSFWDEGDARLAACLVATPATPDEGVPVGVPIGCRSRHGLNDLLPGLEAPALQR